MIAEIGMFEPATFSSRLIDSSSGLRCSVILPVMVADAAPLICSDNVADTDLSRVDWRDARRTTWVAVSSEPELTDVESELGAEFACVKLGFGAKPSCGALDFGTTTAATAAPTITPAPAHAADTI